MKNWFFIIHPKEDFDSSASRLETIFKKHEIIIIVLLCVIAAFRIFMFNAAFPLFNNIDEQAHFDTVVKYSRGYLPHKGDNVFDRESSELIVLYGTPEYFKKPQDFRSGTIPPPLWSYPANQISGYVNKSVNYWANLNNHEAFSPPVYYGIAGIWYNIGKQLGLRNGYQLYWVRFLNVVVYVLLMWVSYLFCKNIYKEDLFLRFGVPLMLVSFPQDLFYSINNDVLSPLLFLFSLYLLVQMYLSNRNRWFYCMTGIVIAATFLTKLSNVPVIAILTIMVFLKGRIALKEGYFKKEWPNLLLLLISSVLPVAFWLGWNFYALGDITGTAEKVSDLGWTTKSLSQIWDHPIFTPNGLILFMNDLMKTFWRGEFVWHLKRLASSKMDLFYIATTYIFLIASVAGYMHDKYNRNSKRKVIHCLMYGVIFFSVFFLAVLSTLYDYGGCWYPSSEYPYFTSGRLISGMLVPFIILYLRGLHLICMIDRRIDPFVVMIGLAVLIMYSEIFVTHDVFASAYNWFHLQG